MSSLKGMGKLLIKFGKGFFIIHLFILSGTVLIQSCKKTEIRISDKKAENFLAKLKNFQEVIQKVPMNQINNSFASNFSNSSNSTTDEEVVGVIYDETPPNPNSYDVLGISTLINNYGGTLTNNPSDTSIIYTYSPTVISNSLNPLIEDAKDYLNARGMSDAEIAIMIAEENTVEYDLVPYVAALANYELSGSTAKTFNYQNLLLNQAYASDDGPGFLHCAGVALGVDAIWALGGSNASSWTLGTMKTVFKSVAKRFLGPIGVAIAVVTFALCLNGIE